MNNRLSICVLCYASFEATTTYGLCHACWQKDKLREWDRLHSAYKDAKRARIPASLELHEWLSVLSDFRGRCAYCLVEWYSRIDIVEKKQGLVKGNVVPICRACMEHKASGWDAALFRVHAYTQGDTSFLPPLEDIFAEDNAEVKA